jgi:hypothetical protein
MLIHPIINADVNKVIAFTVCWFLIVVQVNKRVGNSVLDTILVANEPNGSDKREDENQGENVLHGAIPPLLSPNHRRAKRDAFSLFAIGLFEVKGTFGFVVWSGVGGGGGAKNPRARKNKGASRGNRYAAFTAQGH